MRRHCLVTEKEYKNINLTGKGKYRVKLRIVYYCKGGELVKYWTSIKVKRQK